MSTFSVPLPVLDPAPVFSVQRWFNAPDSFQLSQLVGSVVAVHTFQMLCPGCVSHGLPQAVGLQKTFSGAPFWVVGLHTVFEHHAVMTPEALAVFLHEYRITHPVGVDEPSTQEEIPTTMSRLNLKGTPSLVLLDGQGRVRASHFGRPSDLLIGGQIGNLLAELEHARALTSRSEGSAYMREADADDSLASVCNSDGCAPSKEGRST